jgi:DNA polymerase (family 10)
MRYTLSTNHETEQTSAARSTAPFPPSNTGMNNCEVAAALSEMAVLLELVGENPYKVRAYQRAARVVESLGTPVEVLAADRALLTAVPGIGSGIADKITELLAHGHIRELDELKGRFPQGVFEILAIPGMGPKRTRQVFHQLGVTDVTALRRAAEQGLLRALDGFGPTLERDILEGIAFRERAGRRMLLGDADALAAGVTQALAGAGVVRWETCGSLRRRCETVGDLDILCSLRRGAEETVLDRFCAQSSVEKVIARGQTKWSVRVRGGTQVDVRIVPDGTFGAALQYFTGSQRHNIALREHALRCGLSVSEYGIAPKKGGRPRPIADEEDLYRTLGLQWIPPELREDRGEIAAALNGTLPRLVEPGDIRGDFHVHTNFSDGMDDIATIVRVAEARGYEWLVLTDHSQSLTVARGLSRERLAEKLRAVDAARAATRVELLVGAEVDILPDGTLDYADDVLASLDFVIVAVHTRFKMSERTMTDRIKRALDNRYVHALAHPTGRMIGERDPYPLDLPAVYVHAASRGTALEINASQERLDLADTDARAARAAGVQLLIGSDSHAASALSGIRFGVSVARRAWLGPGDLLNTLSASEVRAWLTRRR